jgi:hypothetical protein
MHLTPSHRPEDACLREARRCVFDGKPIPILVQERLWARGIDVTELEQRLIQSQAFAS